MRIAIVNDVGMTCEALRRIVVSTPGHEVAWIARDGAEALACARNEAPDLILMDLVMPGVGGVEATRRIMNEAPCPILVVTSSVSGNLTMVYEAMSHGALDAVDTPALGPRGASAGAAVLLSKIDMIAKLTGKSSGKESVCRASAPTPTRPAAYALVLIGASTGGPGALAEILSGLPRTWNACVIIIQHIDSAFAPGLAQWLSSGTGREVQLIAEGRLPAPGRFFLSATNDHVVLGPDGTLRYRAEPSDLWFRPSVDIFFSSVADHWPEPGVAALLTGIGSDGAVGLLQLRRNGWFTIAQDESSSVIWGMPKAAVEIGAAIEVLPVSKIAAVIVDRVRTAASC